MNSSTIALQESFKLIMGRLVKILKDFEGMLRIGKMYTGKLESTFAFASSKRLVAVEKDLRKLFKGSNFQNEEQFLASSFTPAMKSFVLAVKYAVNGDFTEVDIRIYEVRKLSIQLVQLMKGSFHGQQTNFEMDQAYELETQMFLPPQRTKVTNTRNRMSMDSIPTINIPPTPKTPIDRKKSSSRAGTPKTRSEKNAKTRLHRKPRPQSVSLSNISQMDISSYPSTTDIENNLLDFHGKWKCINCNTQNKDQRIVCNNCGTTKFDSKHTKMVKPNMIDNGSEVWYCKQCNTPHPNSKISCDICTAKLESYGFNTTGNKSPTDIPKRSYTVIHDKPPKW